MFFVALVSGVVRGLKMQKISGNRRGASVYKGATLQNVMVG